MTHRDDPHGDDLHLVGMTKVAARILRVHPEPCEYITENTIHSQLTRAPSAYVEYLKSHLTNIATGRSKSLLPSKAIFPDGPGKGDFRVMPCVFDSGTHVTKTVKIVGTNLTEVDIPDQVTVGKAVCIHPDDNYITHIFEACLLSSARTGACVSIAISQLAPSPKTISIVGSGRVAYYVALYAAELGGVEEIIFHDTDEQRARLISSWGNLDLGVRCRAATAGAGVERSEVVVLATTSTTPLFAPADLDADLVVSVGADTEEQRELASSWAQASDLYCDVLDSLRVGDLKAWQEEGVVQPHDLMDLLTLLKNGPRARNGKPRVFISTGSALFDNLTIAYLLHR